MSKKMFDIPSAERPKKKNEKVTWKMIREDFNMRHPNSKKHVIHTIPVDAGVLRVFMDDGRVLLYYYDTHSTVPDYNYREKYRDEDDDEMEE